MLHLLDSKLELLDEKRLRQAIKKYADFLSIPILLQGNQVNECTSFFFLQESIDECASIIPGGSFQKRKCIVFECKCSPCCHFVPSLNYNASTP